ncbi:MAG: class I SAM-dependent methyltransferase [Rhodobacteraceae bacterium]|nr:class I SAM-dependent methyltransferase [Paracoccaceae bacterium]
MPTTDRLSLPFETGQIEVPEAGTILCLNARVCPALKLMPRDRFVCDQSFFPEFDALDQAGYNFALDDPPFYTLSIVQLTRSRDENRGNLALAWNALSAGGKLLVDGDKTDGIESVLKAVKKLLPIEGCISKAHGKVFWATKAETPPEFSDWMKRVEPAQNTDGYWTKPGMFSADSIDKGSQELVPHIAGKLSGRGADLGAGWGYLSEQALLNNPAITALELFEADNKAIECLAKNLNDKRIQPLWMDVASITRLMPDLDPFDFIIMNPPFHQSRKAEPAIGQQFIQTAARLLKPSGKLYMVANRQLAYERTLGDCFNHWEQLSQTGQFKCILARKPKR